LWLLKRGKKDVGYCSEKVARDQLEISIIFDALALLDRKHNWRRQEYDWHLLRGPVPRPRRLHGKQV
jgi:hypothetical protein